MAEEGKRKSRRRRGRGEGSVYQRGDGVWCGSVSLGYDARGKRRRPTVHGATKQEVQEALRKLQNDAGGGQLADAGRLTVKEYLNRWLENTHRPKVQPTTWVGDDPKIRLRLIPHLGHVKLAKLS